MTIEITRLLRGDEGEVLHAYKDHLGYLTLGVGRLIDERKGGGISVVESAYLLANDIGNKTQELSRRVPFFNALDPVRKGVLVSMAFQMGVDGLLGFKNTMAMIEHKAYAEAAKGMLNSLWAAQTPERAHRMSEQMRLGSWHYKAGT